MAPAKAGPDYIDPAFHAAACGRSSVTLDAWAMSLGDLRARAPVGDLVLVEGAMGLFDGACGSDREGQGASAGVARALGLPVLMVIDGAKTAQSAGAVVAGMAAWASDVRIAGVILNRVGSARHEAMLRRSVETVCPVVGVLRRDPSLALPSRHLGLVQASERADLDSFMEHAADAVTAGCDLDTIRALAQPVLRGDGAKRIPPLGQRIAVARDIAFSFAYPHILDDWHAAGAEIIPFSPLDDDAPDPAVDAIWLPGGYPELHAGRLAAAGGFLTGLRDAVDRGCLIYGECGGYMILGTGLVDADGGRHAMAGLLALETSFEARRLHLGYRRLDGGPPPLGGALAAHEFHYATTLRADGTPLFQAADAEGADLDPMGLRAGSVMGSFAHVICPA